MSDDYVRLLEDSIEIEAPPDLVWPLVSDIRRMPDWSPLDVTVIDGGEGKIELGVRFTNQNSHGDLQWETHGEIVRFAPMQEIAFRVEENWVIWSFRLEPTSLGGTVLTQRRETPNGISELSLRLTDGFMGGQRAFTAILRDGMRQTLAGIKATAEG